MDNCKRQTVGCYIIDIWSLDIHYRFSSTLQFTLGFVLGKSNEGKKS